MDLINLEQNVYQEAHVNFWKKVYLAAIHYCKRLAVRTRTFFFFFLEKLAVPTVYNLSRKKWGVNNVK